jgi:hypothetical protein
MLDTLVRSEREPDVVQLSGGEPTLHPKFFEIVEAAKARPIRHLMINTNGVRLAKDPAVAERLASYQPGLEIYLQFDSFEAEALRVLRGVDLTVVREQAVSRCNEVGLSVTLVSTVRKGLNDGELGKTIEWALTQPSVRGVTFQPIQAAGRHVGYDPARDRLTLSQVRRKILEQTQIFSPDDILPVPCHPDAMAYARLGGLAATDVVGWLDLLLNEAKNTIVFGREPNCDATCRSSFPRPLRLRPEPTRCGICCLPKVAPSNHKNPSGHHHGVHGRAQLDVRSVKKSCVHIVQPDGRIVPGYVQPFIATGSKKAAIAWAGDRSGHERPSAGRCPSLECRRLINEHAQVKGSDCRACRLFCPRRRPLHDRQKGRRDEARRLPASTVGQPVLLTKVTRAGIPVADSARHVDRGPHRAWRMRLPRRVRDLRSGPGVSSSFRRTASPSTGFQATSTGSPCRQATGAAVGNGAHR